MKSYIYILFWFIFVAITVGKLYPSTTTSSEAQIVGSITTNGSVKEMVLSPATQEFPEHEGKKEFIAYCAICHSLKYVSMQPDFPRKTWDAEVHKMVEKFGAPIDSITGKKIVDYLVAIKGNVTK